MSEWIETDFGKIPKTWDLKPISDIKSSEKSAIAMGPFGSNIKAENFVDEGVPVIRGTNLNFDKYVGGEFVFLTEEKADHLRGSNCKAGDLVFTHRGTIGQVGLIPEGKYRRYVVSQSGMKLTVDPSKINNQFLFYFFKSDGGQHQLLKNEGQVGVPSISNPLTSLKELTVPVPPMEEQIAIVDILSALDNKIDLLLLQNNTLEQIAQTLFRQWFLEEINKDWPDKRLEEFIGIKHGFAFKGAHITSDPTSLILVTPGNFKIGGGFKYNKFKYYTKSDFPEIFVFKPGDLAVTMTDLSVEGDTLGYPAFIPESFQGERYLHNQRVGKVEMLSHVGSNFVYYLMKTPEYQWHVLGGASGTAIRHTSPSSIRSFSFKLPPDDQLRIFENQAKGLHAKIAKNQVQIQKLIKFRNTILPKLMSGEISLAKVTA